ncbi:MAG: VWA domain-containing protein [Acidobacteria bacterium]|nr:VWA domain-containing protein [Acidobacteriota bacterium]
MNGPVVMTAVLGASLLAGQQAPQQNPPVIRSTTRLVQVSVLVRDGRGAPVTGLKQEDFSLLDNGEPQEIALFLEERPANPAAAPGGVRPQLPPGVFSNRHEFRERAPANLTVVLLDGLNTDIRDQAWAKRQVVDFLAQLTPQDRIALYGLAGTGLRILHDYTTDIASLLEALARHRGELAAAVQNPAASQQIPLTGIESFDESLRETLEREERLAAEDRVVRTSAALRAIASHLAGLPGRKNLVWVSISFPFTLGMTEPRFFINSRHPRVFSHEIESAARALNEANLAVYPVDARGLVGNLAFATDVRGDARFYRGATGSFPMRSLHAGGHESMLLLAQRTGGRAFLNSNDVRGALREALDESRSSYLVGYQPVHNQWDGRFRRIQVRLRPKGLEVRHRRGYLALPEQPQDEKTRQALLRDALWSPLEATGIALTATVARADPAKPRSISILAQIDSRSLDPAGASELDLFCSQRSPEGQHLDGTMEKLSVRFEPGKAPRGGILYRKDLELAPGAHAIRLVVRDPATGAIGSLGIPVT